MSLPFPETSRRLVALGKKRLLREGLWVTLGYGATIVCGLLGVRIFTELAAPSVFGGANLLIGMVTLGIQTLNSPIAQTQIRFHSGYVKNNEGDSFTSIIARLACLVSLVLSAVTSAAFLFWPSLRIGAGSFVVVLLVGYIFTSVYRGVLISRLQAERRQKSYSVWITSEAFAILAMTGIALYIWPKVEGYIAGQLFGMAWAAIFFGFSDTSKIFKTINDENLSWQVRHQVVHYGAPFVLFSILNWISSLSERYVLAVHLNAASVGLYVGAFSIASRIPLIFGGVLADIFRPVLFEAKNDENVQNRVQIVVVYWTAALCLSGVVVIGIVYWFGPALSSILLAQAYRASAPGLMFLICIGFTLATFTAMFDQIMFANTATGLALIPKLAGAITGLTIAILLVPSAGVQGAAMASCLGNAGQFLAALLICSRSIGVRQILVPKLREV